MSEPIPFRRPAPPAGSEHDELHVADPVREDDLLGAPDQIVGAERRKRGNSTRLWTPRAMAHSARKGRWQPPRPSKMFAAKTKPKNYDEGEVLIDPGTEC